LARSVETPSFIVILSHPFILPGRAPEFIFARFSGPVLTRDYGDHHGQRAHRDTNENHR
jgi:hypothetical protein